MSSGLMLPGGTSPYTTTINVNGQKRLWRGGRKAEFDPGNNYVVIPCVAKSFSRPSLELAPPRLSRGHRFRRRLGLRALRRLSASPSLLRSGDLFLRAADLYHHPALRGAAQLRRRAHLCDPADAIYTRACSVPLRLRRPLHSQPRPISRAALVAPPASFEVSPRYAPAAYPRHHHRYVPVAPRYYERHIHRPYSTIRRHERRYAVRAHRHASHHVVHRKYYR